MVSNFIFDCVTVKTENSVVKRVQWHELGKERGVTISQAIAGERELVAAMRCLISSLL